MPKKSFPLGLGLATLRGSVVALWIAIVLFGGDALLGIYATMEAGGTPPTGGIVSRVFIIIAMVKAATAAGSKPPGGNS